MLKNVRTPKDCCAVIMYSFGDLQLSEWLVSTLNEVGMNNPTEIQRLAIPAILKGHNLSGRSPTGTGKTACFALPILEHLSADPFGVFAIILTPARELALQIAQQVSLLGNRCNVEVATIIGGVHLIKQINDLSRKPHIVVATPGRLAQLINHVDAKHAKYLVLDEIDRLLQPEFACDLETIRHAMPDSIQTLFFSATLSESVSSKIQSTLVDSGLEYTQVSASFDEFTTASTVIQRYMFIPSNTKDAAMLYCLENLNFDACIIFASTCVAVQELHAALTELELDTVSLHSGLSQDRRFASLGKFKEGLCKILIATDVASRGLDIPRVELVVNYDIGSSVDYVHRIGRTGRAGKPGLAITLVTQFDVKRLLALESSIGVKLEVEECDDDALGVAMKKIGPARRVGRLKLGEYLNKRGAKSSVVRSKKGYKRSRK